MHIGMWIRIVRQLYESTQQNYADLSLQLQNIKKNTLNIFPPDKSMQCMKLDGKRLENEIMANMPI